MIMWAKKHIGGQPELAKIAHETAKVWTDIVVNILKLQTSTKNRFLPIGPAADAARHGCQVHHCTAKIATRGIDLGVDTVAALKRAGALLRSRLCAR